MIHNQISLAGREINLLERRKVKENDFRSLNIFCNFVNFCKHLDVGHYYAICIATEMQNVCWLIRSSKLV